MKIIVFLAVFFFVNNSYGSDSITFDEEGLSRKYLGYGGVEIHQVIDDFIKGAFDVKASASLLELMSAEDIKLLRNSVFAKNGYIFKSDELNAFFKSKKWYQPKSKIVSLTKSEADLVNFILNMENGGDYSFDEFLSEFPPMALPVQIDGNSTLPFDDQVIKSNVMRKFLKTDIGVLSQHPYAVGELYRNERFIAVLLGSSDAAGGGSVYYDIATFTPKGDLIYKVNISQSGGDISSYSETRFTVDEKLNIDVLSAHSGMDDEGNETGSETTERYYINTEGIVVESD